MTLGVGIGSVPERMTVPASRSSSDHPVFETWSPPVYGRPYDAAGPQQ